MVSTGGVKYVDFSTFAFVTSRMQRTVRFQCACAGMHLRCEFSKVKKKYSKKSNKIQKKSWTEVFVFAKTTVFTTFLVNLSVHSRFESGRKSTPSFLSARMRSTRSELHVTYRNFLIRQFPWLPEHFPVNYEISAFQLLRHSCATVSTLKQWGWQCSHKYICDIFGHVRFFVFQAYIAFPGVWGTPTLLWDRVGVLNRSERVPAARKSLIWRKVDNFSTGHVLILPQIVHEPQYVLY